MTDYSIRLNGFEYDWNNTEITALGITLTGVTKIDYTISRNMQANYGWHDQPVSYSYGNVTYQCSIEMYLSQWNEIVTAAPQNDPTRIPPFDLSVSYGSFNSSQVLSYRDILRDVQFMSNNRALSQGEMGTKITIPFMVSTIELSEV